MGQEIVHIILGMGSANVRRRYYVTSSLIGQAHTQNDFWIASSEKKVVWVRQPFGLWYA